MPRNPNDRSTPPDPSLCILASLASGPKHGYAMTEDIASFAGVRLGPGTLYGAIARLEERGLIAALPADERRRPYTLTALGRTTLADQLARIHALAQTGLDRLATAG